MDHCVPHIEETFDQMAYHTLSNLLRKHKMLLELNSDHMIKSDNASTAKH